jgi:alkylation response protein AidB-like acyl-CoA dehydrogenase
MNDDKDALLYIPAFGFESPEQKAMTDSLARLCARHVTEDYLKECDRQKRYPDEAMRELADAGWAGLVVPEQYGGSGGSARDVAVLHRTIARFGLAPAQAFFSLWALGAEAINRLGTEQQRDRWLPELAEGNAKVAFALTEPDSGSDAAALRTRAERHGDFLVLNGQKVFITGAAVADVIITAVRTRAPSSTNKGISLVLLDPRADGVQISPLEKVGLKALDLCEVFLDDVQVPIDAVLGPLHQGWESLRAGLANERLLVAAICVGAMHQILDLCVAYARQREAFGQPIGAFQLIAARLVNLRVQMEASDLLVSRAAAAIDAGRPDAAILAAMAKLHATEAYVSAARDGVQVFGGYGYTEDYPVARHYRDAKFMEIGGGTSEIQTMIIARSMGLG